MQKPLLSLLITTSFVTCPIIGMEQNASSKPPINLHTHHSDPAILCCTDFFKAIRESNPRAILKIAQQWKIVIEAQDPETGLTPLLTATQREVLKKATVFKNGSDLILDPSIQVMLILLMLKASPSAAFEKAIYERPDVLPGGLKTAHYPGIPLTTTCKTSGLNILKTSIAEQKRKFVIEILMDADRAYMGGGQHNFIQHLFELFYARQKKLPFAIKDLINVITKQGGLIHTPGIVDTQKTSASLSAPTTQPSPYRFGGQTSTTKASTPVTTTTTTSSTRSMPLLPAASGATPTHPATTISSSIPTFNNTPEEKSAFFDAIKEQRLVPILSLAYSPEFNIEIREEGKTPLMAAAIHGNMHVLYILLMLGANPLAIGEQNGISITALDLAETAHNAVAVGLLTEALQAWRNHTQNAFIAKLFSQAEAEHLAVPMDVLEEMIAQQKTKVTELH